MSQKKTIIIDVEAKDGIKQVDQLKKGVEGVDSSSKGAKAGLGGMTGVTKKLGVAFKALGIGLIVSAFVKLKDIFSGNIETARQFEVISAKLGAAFDVIRDRAEEFIKSLIAMKNPFKAFRDAFKGTGEEVRKETKAMGEFTKALQKVRDEERDLLTVRAEANKKIAESRLLAEDETKSREERLVALRAAIEEETRVADIEKQIQKDKVDALQAIIDLGKSSEEDMQNLAAERARLTELETASILKQKRVVTEINTFEREIAAEKKREHQEELKREKEKEDARKKELADIKKLEEEKLKKQQQAAEGYQKVIDRNMSESDKASKAIRAEYKVMMDAVTQSLIAGNITAEESVNQLSALSQERTDAIIQSNAHFAEKEEEQRQANLEFLHTYFSDAEFIEQNYSDKQIELLVNRERKNREETAKTAAFEDAKRQAGLSAAKGVTDALGGLAKEGTKGAKAMALTGILIDTAKGVSGAIAAGASVPFPGNLVAIATGITSVLAGIANAKSVLAKVPGGGDGGGEPSINTPTGGDVVNQGIGGNLIPNMEAIEQPQLGQQPLQAFVVENDISNAQALQEELETQATL